MKTFTKFLLAAGLATLGSRAASAQVLYDNFEDTRLVTYSYVSGALAPVANPGGGTVNTSVTSGKYDRDATQYAVVVMNPTNAHMADVSDYVAGTKKLSMKFRSPAAGTVVQLVLQNKAKSSVNVYPKGDYAGTFSATTTAAADTWETLTFTFAARDNDETVTATTVDQLTMLVAPNTLIPTTYYLDDITGPELVAGSLTPTVPTPPVVAAPPVLLDDFENTRLVDYPLIQGTLAPVANPGSDAVNSSATCASYLRDGAQQFATIDITPKNGAKFADVSAYADGTQKVTMKFRSAAANTVVQLVLQNRAKNIATPYNYPQGNYLGTLDATTTVANAWETLTFTFTNRAANNGADGSVTATTVDQIAMLINPNSNGSGTYYFDDLTGPAITGTVTATRATSAAALASVYPNPAAGLAHLPYNLQKSAVVSLGVYDALGRRAAAVLDNQAQPAGEHSADINTAGLAPGLYTCRLVVDGTVLTRQLSVQ